jgi:two-component system sensor histidine kinase DcuS
MSPLTGARSPKRCACLPRLRRQHEQIGVVVVGSLNKVEEQIARGRLNAVWTILFSIFMSSMAIWGLVRVLKRILFGLEPYEISALFEQRQAMLQSLREGCWPSIFTGA